MTNRERLIKLLQGDPENPQIRAALRESINCQDMIGGPYQGECAKMGLDQYLDLAPYEAEEICTRCIMDWLNKEASV